MLVLIAIYAFNLIILYIWFISYQLLHILFKKILCKILYGIHSVIFINFLDYQPFTITQDT